MSDWVATWGGWARCKRWLKELQFLWLYFSVSEPPRRWLFKSIIWLFRVYNILFWQFIADGTNISIPKKLVSTNFVPIWLLLGVGTVKKRVCSTRNIFSTHVRVFEMPEGHCQNISKEQVFKFIGKKPGEPNQKKWHADENIQQKDPNKEKKIIGLTVKNKNKKSFNYQ